MTKTKRELIAWCSKRCTAKLHWNESRREECRRAGGCSDYVFQITPSVPVSELEELEMKWHRESLGMGVECKALTAIHVVDVAKLIAKHKEGSK